MNPDQFLTHLIEKAQSRSEFWVDFLDFIKPEEVAEIGVFKGELAETLLRKVPAIRRYYMLDPWRNLEDWNKPANKDNNTFETIYQTAMARTRFAADKVVVLRGKTTEVVDRIPDESLDFAYIDGDHTLKGITIDLLRLYPKVKPGGWIAGDDFCRSIWQHSKEYEPTLIFPFAVYFAEAMGVRIRALPFNQFLMRKSTAEPFEFIDHTGRYDKVSLREQLEKPPSPKSR